MDLGWNLRWPSVPCDSRAIGVQIKITQDTDTDDHGGLHPQQRRSLMLPSGRRCRGIQVPFPNYAKECNGMTVQLRDKINAPFMVYLLVVYFVNVIYDNYLWQATFFKGIQLF